jgi:hypothetical protein
VPSPQPDLQRDRPNKNCVIKAGKSKITTFYRAHRDAPVEKNRLFEMQASWLKRIDSYSISEERIFAKS